MDKKTNKRIKQGKLIVIEGGVGCGKTTQTALLIKDLKGWELYHEPGSTPYGEKVRDAVQGLHGYGVEEHAAMFGYAASRANLIRGLVIPKLNKGVNIILDRYWYTTYAYQGSNGVADEIIISVNKIATAGLKPDLILFYDLNPKIGMQRKSGREDTDRYDVKKLEFHKKVRRRYHKLGKKIGKNWKVVDASKTIEEVHSETLKILKKSKII